MNVSEKATVVVSTHQVSSDLAGEAAILNLKDGVYYGLDPVGARVWNLIQQRRTLEELCDILSCEYYVEMPRLEADLRNLLIQLADKDLVEITGD